MCDECFPKMEKTKAALKESMKDASDTALVVFARTLEEMVHLRTNITKINTRDEALNFIAWTKVQIDMAKEDILGHQEQVKETFEDLVSAIFAVGNRKKPGAESVARPETDTGRMH